MLIIDSGMCHFSIDTTKNRDCELYDLFDVKVNFGQTLLDYSNKMHTRLPGSHPTEQMHEIFAKEVYECMTSYM